MYRTGLGDTFMGVVANGATDSEPPAANVTATADRGAGGIDASAGAGVDRRPVSAGAREVVADECADECPDTDTDESADERAGMDVEVGHCGDAGGVRLARCSNLVPASTMRCE